MTTTPTPRFNSRVEQNPDSPFYGAVVHEAHDAHPPEEERAPPLLIELPSGDVSIPCESFYAMAKTEKGELTGGVALLLMSIGPIHIHRALTPFTARKLGNALLEMADAIDASAAAIAAAALTKAKGDKS